MRFACLYAPNFSLQAAWRGQPEMFDQAAAVVDGTPLCLRVIAANEKARQAGVVIGMTQSAAGELSAIRRRLEAQEQSAHAALLDCARAFSPRIEDTAIDTVLLDLEGLERLLGPACNIAQQALDRAGELGLKIHVAIAASPDAAIIAARGFSGITLITAGQEAERLAELPVEILNPSSDRLASEGLEVLHAWGIHQLKELAALPPVQLSARLGQEGVRWWRLAQGGHSRPLMLAQEAERWEEAWELEYPAETLDALDFVLSSVLTRLSKRLAVRSLATQELRLKLDLAEAAEPEPSLALDETRRRKDAFSAMKVYERTLRFPLPLCNAALFFKLWRLRLDSDLPPAPVLRVTIAAEPARPRPAQGGLFAPLAPDPERLELTLARIKSLVGNGNVGSPALIDSHKPYAFCMNEFSVPRESQTLRQPPRRHSPASMRTFSHIPGCTQGVSPDPSPGPRRLVKAPAAAHSLPSGEGKNSILVVSPAVLQAPSYQMALRVFRPSMPARVEWHSGRPTYLLSSTIRGRILFAAGPWRNSGDWWNDEGWNVEEWDVEVDTGPRHNVPPHRRKANPVYRLCHDLAHGEWYLQGEYD
jgi:protein ImuB